MSIPQQYVSQFQTYLQAERNYIINNTPAGNPIPTFGKGGPADLLTGAHATACDMLGQDIYNAQLAAYVSTATGTDLDNKAADYGVYRKQAVAASQNFNFNKKVAATQAITIPQGTVITTIPTLTQPAVQFTTTADVTLAIGNTTVSQLAICNTAGVIGNLPANTQLLLASAVPGIDTVTLTTAITNGLDQETDDALRVRTKNAFAGLALGTANWYIAEATSVAGVSTATVVPNYQVANGIAVYCAGPNNTIPNSTVIANVQTKLNNDRPQIDKPTALAPTALPVNITITVVAAPGADAATVQANVQNAISNWIKTILLGASNYNGTVYPSQVGTQALSQTSVLDYNSVTINGVAGPLTVSASQLPQPGTITVTVNIA